MASTAIRCDGVGISLSGAAGSQYSFKGISFLPRQRGRGTALKLNWSEAVVGKGFSIEDVGFGSRGPDKSNYFNRALEIRNKGTGQILGCWFNGLSDVDPQGEGIVLASANDVTVTNTFMYNLAYACRSDGATSLEGFRMHGGSLVRVGHGVYFQSDPVGLPHIEVALSHINACYGAIHVEGYSQVNIVDNLLYGRKDTRSDSSQTDILIKNCPSATIARNKFFSGVDKSKQTKTAIKTIGSIRNANISDNLASERTIFLDVLDDGVSGAQDIRISNNRAERDLEGNSTVTEMYRFTESPMHKRITWDYADQELATVGTVSTPSETGNGKWQVVPFVPIEKEIRQGIEFKPVGDIGQFVVPSGVSAIVIRSKVRLEQSKEGSCDIRIMMDDGKGFEEVAVGSAFGRSVTAAVETDLLPVSFGSRIRIELRTDAEANLLTSPLLTNVIFSPR